ncbi:hypothetical protein QF031_001977 [Pseudarthrobacter defluvii]|uniref:hypothetical protein n=1 Tax=Pseudarthrobacter defluvii TaxID=410837 RepID=UPI00277DAFD0|nr:hypothetical protein [Pseudarthrobacter defluvii]MDQ0769228.1 hypothetical protein [Pseudarthrobacter defluvii]
MGAIFGTALSLVLTVGGAAVATEGGPGAAQHYLAGHVLLGVGIGLLIATLMRAGVRMLLARASSQSRKPTSAQPEASPATVTMLPVRSTAPAPMRGRHAA